MIHKIFRRPCRRCGEEYQPEGKYQTLCDNCNLNTYKSTKRKNKYD